MHDLLKHNNVGAYERGIRLGAGVVGAMWALAGGSLLLALIGAIIAVTGYFGSCHVYKLLGRNTNTGAD